MHNLIENYLLEVERSLQLLPKTRRAEELQEMRQHLQNAVIVNQEAGDSEDEAVQSAVEQFGSPEALGQDIVQAWQREQILRRRSLWGATTCTFLIALLLPYLLRPLISPYFPNDVRVLQTDRFLMLNEIYNLSIFAVAGLVSGLAFPKRAVAGGGLAVAVMLICYLIQTLIQIADYYEQPVQRYEMIIVYLKLFLSQISWNVLSRLLVVTLAAWAGTLWRGRQARLARE